MSHWAKMLEESSRLP